MPTNENPLIYHLLTVIIFLLLLLITGTMGYVYLEGWDWFDALYMTFISFSTVGFNEVKTLHFGSRLFTMLLILFGMVGIAMLSASVTSWFVSNQLLARRKVVKTKQRMTRLKDHIIICGAGDTGRTIIQEFMKADKPFVLIESKPQVIKDIQEHFPDILLIEGDATKDEILEEAEISKAGGLITALSLDADNLFVVVSARALNPNMLIISRAVEVNTEHKLYHAGANYVISPNMVEGMRMASVILRPMVISFLEVMTTGDGLSLQMEEFGIPETSSFQGKRLSELQIPQRTGLIVLAIKYSDTQNWNFNPSSASELSADDKLIVLGEPEKLEKLRNLLDE